MGGDSGYGTHNCSWICIGINLSSDSLFCGIHLPVHSVFLYRFLPVCFAHRCSRRFDSGLGDVIFMRSTTLIPGIMMVISLIFLIMTEILTFYLLLTQMLNASSIWNFIEYSVLFIAIFAVYIFIDVIIILLLMDERN